MALGSSDGLQNKLPTGLCMKLPKRMFTAVVLKVKKWKVWIEVICGSRHHLEQTSICVQKFRVILDPIFENGSFLE